MVASLFSPPVSAATSPPASARALRSALSRREALHDAGLVQRFNAGDETAFDEIVIRYRERLMHVAWQMLRNHADAEEIAQDTFIRAHRSLALFRSESSLYSWLHRIALNLSRNRYWYFFRRRRHATQSLDSTVNEQSSSLYSDLVASPAPGPVREAATREFSALVTACMARLNAGQREILHLRNGQEHSYRDIARQLNIDVGTVKSRIARARERLRTLLAESYDGTARHGPGSTDPWFEASRPAGLLSTLNG